MSSTRATDIHFKNNWNESSRFLLDNEHQDVLNVTPDTVLKGSIYRITFNYLGPIRYKTLFCFCFCFCFFFIPSRPYIKPGSMPPKYQPHCRRYRLWYFSEIRGYNAAGNKKHRLRAKLSSSQRRKHSGRGKAWHGLCYQQLRFSYQSRAM